MDVEQLIGDPPAWMELGPEQTIDGVVVREVLGDYSARHECDRPPKYVTPDHIDRPVSPAWDTSDSRPPVRSYHPGRPISELRGLHSGRVAILFNGESLSRHNLFHIKVPIIGMNRTHAGWPTYVGPQPDYLCVIDHCWFEHESVRSHPRLINGSTHRGNYGYRVARSFRMRPFSFDLDRDGFVPPIPASTGHLALQLAVYLGFTELFCLGLDMGGRHFDRTASSPFLQAARSYHRRQAPVLKAHGINVWVCGSPDSACDAFPHASFEEVCRGEEKACA